MGEEEWRPVVGYEGLYEVSSHGRVRSLDRIAGVTPGAKRNRKGRLMKFKSRRRYLQVCLYPDRKYRSLHVLVCEAFHGPKPFEGAVARHLNDDKRDNRSSNIAWGTQSENVLDAVRNGVHPEVKVTHCPQGHEYTTENTARVRGSRVCKTCRRVKHREYTSKLKPEDAPHGTYNGYSTYHCRCSECKEAARVYRNNRKEVEDAG